MHESEANSSKYGEFGIIEGLPDASLVLDLRALKARLEELGLAQPLLLSSEAGVHPSLILGLLSLIEIRASNAVARESFLLEDTDGRFQAIGLSPESQPALIRLLQSLLADKKCSSECLDFVSPSGLTRPWDVRVSMPVAGDWSQILVSLSPEVIACDESGLGSLLQDRRLLETMTFGFALHEMLFDPAGTPIDYRFLAVNAAFEHITGLNRVSILGRRVLEVLPYTEPHWLETYGKVVLTGEPVSIEQYSRELDRYYEVWAWSPSPGRFAVLVEDVSRRVKSERALAELERRTRNERSILASILDSIQEVVIWKDPAGAFLGCNPTTERLYGKSAEMLLGKTDRDLLPEPTASENMREDRKVFESGEPSRSEGWIVHPTGARRFMERIKAPFLDEKGLPAGVTVVSRDITERHCAETIVAARYHVLEYARAHSSEELLRKALDLAEELTGSEVSFFLTLDDNAREYSLQAWSTKTLEKYCGMAERSRHFPIATAGVWTDCLRERRPVIHNDYPALAHRKGLPPGHLHLSRELLAPIIRDDKIVGILAVGNKAAPYDDIDVLSASQLADQLWEVTQNKIGEERLRKALAEKQTLLQELFHRTKNSMQLINAMMELKKQELGEGPHTKVFDDIQGKILAMALVQEKIYRSGDLSSIDLGDYITELAVLLEDGAPVRPDGVTLRVKEFSKVSVSVDSAIPCGILVSELVSNSLSHAFPAGMKGCINLEVGGSDGGELWIEERDDGIGLPEGFDPRRSPNLGLKTVVGIGEEQLHGHVSFGQAKPGFSCRVTFKDQYRRINLD
jgi:PAS domain S-box-containing protein